MNKKPYKIVLNVCYGGFSLSKKAEQLLFKKLGIEVRETIKRDSFNNVYLVNKNDIKDYKWIKEFSIVALEKELQKKFNLKNDETIVYLCYSDIPRHLKELVEVVEELEKESWGQCSELKVKECYSKLYKIKEFDGLETLEELDDEEIFIIE
jgi:uncharacterized membrane protein